MMPEGKPAQNVAIDHSRTDKEEPRQDEILQELDGGSTTFAADVGKNLAEIPRTHKQEEATVNCTDEEDEAGLALTEMFSLNVEVNLGSDSDNDHSNGDAPTATHAGGSKKDGIEDEQGKVDSGQGQTSSAKRSSVREVETSMISNRRPQSPVTQAVESKLRKMAQGISSSIDAASASLMESMSEVTQELKRDLGGNEGMVVERLQCIHTHLSRQACLWLKRHEDSVLDQASIRRFEINLTEAHDQCRGVVAKAFHNRCAAAEQRMDFMVDKMAGAFDKHLEDTAAASKQNFKWIKRQYRDKIDVNRVASNIELKDAILLDRCLLEETTRNVVSRHNGELDKQQVEFQLERSEMRKKQRELEQSAEVLKLEILQVEQGAARAYRYIEVLEEASNANYRTSHSDDGNATIKRQSSCSRGISPRGGFNLPSPSPGSRGVSPRNTNVGDYGGIVQERKASSPLGSGNQHSQLPISRGDGDHGPRLSHSHLASSNRASVSSTGSFTYRQSFTNISGGGSNNASGVRQTSVCGGNVSHPPLWSGRGLGNTRYLGKTGFTQDQLTARGRTPSSARGRSPNTARGGAPGTASEGPLCTARQRLPTAALLSNDYSGHDGEWGGSTWHETHINPAMRHEEVRLRCELMQVIENKKFTNLEEALADETLNREAAQTRLELLEKTIPNLHDNLKKAHEQLVYSRMEANELRKLNKVILADIECSGFRRKRHTLEDALQNAVALLEGSCSKNDDSVMAVVAMDRNDQNGASQDTRGLRQERELKQWMIQQQKEYQDSGDEANNSGENWTEGSVRQVEVFDGAGLTIKLKEQIEELEKEKDAILAEMLQLREEVEQRQRVDEQERANICDGSISPVTYAANQVELATLKENRRELERKIAEMQVASGENQFLRRRLEAIERTTLKLNIGGGDSETDLLKKRIEIESREVVRLRGVVDTLQAEKITISELVARAGDESMPLVKVEAERAAFEEQTRALKQKHKEDKANLEINLKLLSDFKAKFENLAEYSVDEKDSDERYSGDGVEKWKQRTKKLQKYIEWQLAEVEAQARRDRTKVALEKRSHEILMGEMTALLKGYRREQAQLYEANRCLLRRLVEFEAQPYSPTTHSPSSSVGSGRTDCRRSDVDNAEGTAHNKAGWCKKKERIIGGVRQGGPGGLALGPVALVPVHTLGNALEPAKVTAGQRAPVSTAPSPYLGTDPAPVKAHLESSRRPKTSTGCERRNTNMPSLETRRAERGTRRTTKETASTRNVMGISTLARELRSRLQEEFLGSASHPAGVRENINAMAARTARHTTRDPMVLSKPPSLVTGSILTNVPLRAGELGGKARPELEKRRLSSEFVRPQEVNGSGDARREGAFW